MCMDGWILFFIFLCCHFSDCALYYQIIKKKTCMHCIHKYNNSGVDIIVIKLILILLSIVVTILGKLN